MASGVSQLPVAHPVGVNAASPWPGPALGVCRLGSSSSSRRTSPTPLRARESQSPPPQPQQLQLQPQKQPQKPLRLRTPEPRKASARPAPLTRFDLRGILAELQRRLQELDTPEARASHSPTKLHSLSARSAGARMSATPGDGRPSSPERMKSSVTQALSSFSGQSGTVLIGTAPAGSSTVVTEYEAHISALAHRCEMQEAALVQKDRRAALLTELLHGAKSSIESLGEEVDSECEELMQALAEKQAMLNETVAELASGKEKLQETEAAATAALAAASWQPPAGMASQREAQLLSEVDTLNRTLQHSEATCERFRREVHSQKALEAATAANAARSIDMMLMDQVSQWEAKCHALEEQAASHERQEHWEARCSPLGDELEARSEQLLATDVVRLSDGMEAAPPRWASVEEAEVFRRSQVTGTYGVQAREAEHPTSEAFQAVPPVVPVSQHPDQSDALLRCEADNQRLQETCETYAQECRASDVLCRNAMADEQRAAERFNVLCAQEAREAAEAISLAQWAEEHSCSSERQLLRVEEGEEQLAQRCRELAEQAEASPSSTSERQLLRVEQSEERLALRCRELQEQVEAAARQELADSQVAASQVAAMVTITATTRWELMTVRLLYEESLHVFRRHHKAWSHGHRRLREQAETLNDQVQTVAASAGLLQDLEKHSEAGERKLVAVEEQCLAETDRISSAARSVTTELREVQTVWTGRTRNLSQELQEERSSRKAAEEGWKQAELLIAHLRAEIQAAAKRGGAAAKRLDAALKAEEAEIASLRTECAQAVQAAHAPATTWPARRSATGFSTRL